ncbi:hypothetical protein SAMN05216188_11946 [Lentzea xinjiangensis]|uniref:GAF domain-containing protein n=1 Tax=Lentzea xinjiangensis TaxID=402600 RepID=A0A1H9TST2_9PSEU|nr:hypothetical protein [Lentzea xinjiangensis]SES00156.1 hypothetical protein SAMN05216188_11946 [Lentzea xinjiangensis]
MGIAQPEGEWTPIVVPGGRDASPAAVEAARIEAVRRYNILDTPPNGAFDRVARLAARWFDVPIASVTIVDSDRIWFKAAHGLDGVTQIGRDPGLCGSAILSDDTYVVTDAVTDQRRATTLWSPASWGRGSTPPRRSSLPTGTVWAR